MANSIGAANLQISTNTAGVRKMIECEDVIKIYDDPETNLRIAALRGIDLKIQKGELISIIGPSGSGKSTLIKILAGLESISSGSAKVAGNQLGAMEPNELLKYRLNTIGLVHQFPERTLFLTGTVMDNLNFASSLQEKNRTERRRKNKEILESLGIAHLENRRVNVLSGGETIRTAIGCMLAKNAPVLLCDEPTGQLDTENTEIVKGLLRQISREYGTTVLVVTHDLRFLKGVDKTCEIHSGRVSSLYKSEEDLIINEREFPLEFSGQIDSSQNVRIPNEIYNILKLENNVKFVLNEDSKVEIKHPEGITPRKIEISEIKKQKRLTIKPLPDDYFTKKKIEIKVEDVSKIYGTRAVPVAAISDVNLQFHKSEFAFVIGPSGSGKTTLIKLLTGLETTTSGKISVLHQDLHEMTDKERAKFRRENIGIVSQQGDLHPFITVKENLFLKDIYDGKTILLEKYPKKELEDIFRMFEITHRKESYPLEISGGELQRASLAIAEFGNPGLLILDEPTANMDAELAESVMNQLYDIQNKLKITLLITTHDINLVRDGTRVIELKDGKVDSDGLAFAIED